MNVQYYELNFGINTSDGVIESEYSMVIKATREPTIAEAENFIADDMENLGYDTIYSILPISEQEVYSFYDTENIDNWKIFS